MSKQQLQSLINLEKIQKETSIYYPSGIINEDTIHEIAGLHMAVMRDFGLEEMLHDLQQHLRICLSMKDWSAAAFCLSIYLGMATEWIEEYFLQMAADKQALQCYARHVKALLDT